MIESIENAVQLVATAFCTTLCAIRMYRTGRREWAYLMLVSGVYFLGDLYYQLFLLFYGETSRYSFIPDMSWYSAYLLLFMLLMVIRGVRGKRKYAKVLWLIPVFTVSMCVFFLQWGDIIGNLLTVVLRTLIMWNAADALIGLRGAPDAERRKRFFYITAFLFCLIEYATDTSSCFWVGDTLRNPYFWFDAMLSITFAVLPSALRRAVES